MEGYTGGYDDKTQSRLSWMIGGHIATGIKQHLNEVLGGASEIVMAAMESAVSVARADIEAAVQKVKAGK